MDKAGMIATLREHKAIAVLRAPSAEGAVGACKAMMAGGMRIMEITTTTVDWEKAMTEAAKLEGIILGLGTAVKPEQVTTAKKAGAAFVVSPGFDLEIADQCLADDIPFFPGIATPSELMMARKHPAVAACKLFPAGALGGVKYLKSLMGPFPDVLFMPTGGVTAENVGEYFAAGCFAVGMSAPCKADLIKAQDWDKITEIARQTMAAVQ